MRALFAERPELCDATLQIAEMCVFDLGLKQVHSPDFPTPAGRSADALLAERCWRGVHERGLPETEPLRERMHHELSLIRRMGYASFFLTVGGIAAGSLVCYLTGISDVDALRHDLSFERFLNPMRDELPDIDIDVESARREDVYDMILSRHGDDRCACVCMVDTYRARGAIREVGKALGLPDVEVDTVAKAFPRHLALHPSGIVLAGHDLIERVPLERSFQGYRMIQADKDDVELLGYLKLDVLGIRMLSAMRHAVDEVARTAGEKVDLDAIPLDDPATFELIRSSDTLGCFQIESPGQRELLQKLQPTKWKDLIVDISLFRPGPVKSDMVSPFLRRRHGMELPVYAHPALRPVLSETHGVVVYHEQVMRTFAAIAGYDLSEADRIRRHLSDDLEVDDIRRDFLRRVRERGMATADAERIWKELASFASFGFCKAHAAAFAVPTYQSSWLKAHWPAHFLAGVLTHEPGMYPRRLMIEDARLHGIPILPLDVNVSDSDYTVELIEETGSLEADAFWWSGSTGPRRARARTAGGPPGAGARVGAGPAAGALSGAKRSEGAKRPPQRPHPEVARDTTSATTQRPGPTYAIRLALKDVHGISDEEVRSILEARGDRPFADVGDFVRRTPVSKPVVERLAHGGAFDALTGGAPGAGRAIGGDGRRGSDPVRSAAFRAGAEDPRPRTRRDRLYAAMVAEPQREGQQLALSLDEEVVPGLREYTDAERVRAELEVVQMDVSRHLISFYEPLLADLGVTRSRDLWKCRGGEEVMVAGVN